MTAHKRIAIVLNPGSGVGGADDAREAMQQHFETSGYEVTMVELEVSLDLAAAVTRLVDAGVTVIAAAGGDGTVNAVASAIIGHDVTFGVLPLGTLNHFARDLSIPVDVDDAAGVIIAGHTTTVDVGEVNGRIFLNNSSVGLYPRIVKLREQHDARGARKWAIAAWATMRAIRNTVPLRVQLLVDGKEVTRSTPLIFIGNNEYRMQGADAASRDSLQDGRLALYLVKTNGQWNLLRLVYRILAGTARESGELAMVTTATAVIDTANGSQTQLDVALDGEVTTMTMPLRYAIRPRALRVLVPRPAVTAD